MSNLKIIDFIKKNKDWEKIISEKPFCIKISRSNAFVNEKGKPVAKNLIMFKYDQIDSDFKEEIVRECRGLILDENTLEAVCIPFFKFGNYGESYVPDIDWNTARVTEKLDGSLIKIVRLGDDLLISTNGKIDAFYAKIQNQIACDAKSYGDLVLNAINRKMNLSEFMKIIVPGITYMFELTSPFNRVVVQWKDTELHFIGARDNVTLQEFFFDDNRFSNIYDIFKHPKIFNLRTLDECISASKKLGLNDEGYVVVDKNFNRVKIKSPTYVSLHHMRDNGNMSYERGVEIVRNNEIAEVVSYFPEFKEHLEKIKCDYDDLISSLEDSWNEFLKNDFNSRKESAIFIQKNFKVPSVGFCLLDKKISSIKEWAYSLPAEKICGILKYN